MDTAHAEATLHPDRLLPADPATRSVARTVLETIAALPIVSVHGHLDAAALAADSTFPDPATLLVSSDHYVLRALHSVGVPLDDLGRGPRAAAPREVWEVFCRHWPVFLGTATGLWLTHELAAVLGSAVPPRPGDFDGLVARLAAPDCRPQALLRRFGVEALSTTDPPGGDYGDHALLQADGFRVVPTLRPDGLTDATRPGWAAAVEATGASSLPGLLAVLRTERVRSLEAGAVATDHGHASAHTEDCSGTVATALFDRVAAGRGDRHDGARLAGHMLLQMGVMALEDRLVLQLHTGVRRDQDGAALVRYGADTGADFPAAAGFTEALRPLLERCGNEAGFRAVVFTTDETTWSRELAPMASYWPGLYLGAPWWFLDAPGAIGRHLAAVSEIAGYAKLAGFVDDTRALCSIAARHDVARRALAAHLAVSVAEHRLTLADAVSVARDYTYDQPRRVYGLDRAPLPRPVQS